MIMYRRYCIIPTDKGQWRIWDAKNEEWVDKYGQPDPYYRACYRDVAEMRVRDFAGARAA